MIKKYIQKNGKFVFFVAAVAAVLSYGAWATTHFVLAYNEEKRVHIFPTVAVASGWEKKEHALTQDLSAQAPFGSFTKDNSAYIEISAPAIPAGGGGGPSGAPSGDTQIPSPEEQDTQAPEEAVNDPDTESPSPTPAVDPDTDPAPPVSESTDTAAASATTPASGHQESASDPPPEAQPPPPESPPPEAQPPPAPPDTSDTSDVQGMIEGALRIALKHMQTYAAFALLQIVPTVSAQVTEENTVVDPTSTTTISTTVPTSTPATSSGQGTQVLQNATDTVAELPAVNDELTPPTIVIDASDQSDIATCTVLGKECHTMEFSGFDIDGEIKKKKLKEFELNFSFASLTNEDQITDGKLQVRYFHAGQWRSAGEIYLNKELSNQTNGSYFTAKLADLDRWNDLSDVRVVFEYISGDGNTSAQLYLDAVWIDGVYKERAQDVLGGDIGPIPSAESENVSYALSDGKAAGPSLLVLSDGGSIAFPYLDNTGDDTLSIRVDQPSYEVASDPSRSGGGEAVVYASVTNTGENEDSFRLLAAFAGGDGTVGSLSQFFNNVATTTSVPVHEDVTYFCEEGWGMASSSSDGTYACLSTGESHQCSWVNELGVNCLVNDTVVGVEQRVQYENTWVPLLLSGAVGSIEKRDQPLPHAYRVTAASEDLVRILPGQTVYFRLVLNASRGGVQRFVLAAQGSHASGDLDSSLVRSEAEWQESNIAQEKTRVSARKQANKQISAKTVFDSDELPEFRFKFKSQRSLMGRLSNIVRGRSNAYALVQARLKRAGIEDQEVPVEVAYGADGEWTMSFKKQPRAFRPGKYSIELTMDDGGQEVIDSFDFYWGVLAVNTDKTIYEPGENAHLMMASLDDSGDTICDANLSLSITDPKGNTREAFIRESGECGPNNVVDVADYLADYTVGETGTYNVVLARLDETGLVLHRISDVFEVRERPAYVVERDGPTRIYPKAPYRMNMHIIAHRAFSGTVTETVPVGTLVSDTGGAELSQYGGAMRLTWQLTLKEGEEARLGYTFDAPDVSPYLYLFGPLVMEDGGRHAFRELRTWKVASDALGSYVEKQEQWSPTTSGSWETKDLSGSPFNVPAGAVLEIALVNADTLNEMVAGVRHASSSLSRTFNIHEAEPQGVTTMVMHVQASATSSIQTYAENTANISFVLLGYWTSGYYVERFDQIDPGIANNTWGNINLSSYGVASTSVAEMVLGNWNTTAENNAGVRRLGSSLSRLANIHESEANGVNGVTMLVKASTTNATIQGFAQVEGANNADVDYWLVGYWSENPTGLDYTERFDDLTGPGSASTWTNRTLNGFGVPPTGIAETLFANAADANSSMLIGVRTSGSTLARTFNLHEAEAGGWDIARSHVKAGSDANATIQYFSEDTASDIFRLLGYWSAGDYPPNAPTLYDQPFDNEKTGTSTPSFLFSASDPDGSSSIVYEIEWDDDAVLDDAPLGSYSSDTDSGFDNVTTPADTSPFNESDQIRFTIPTSLVSGTTYYWRVRATDVSGSGISSDWSDVQSFTYVADTDPSQWMQTEDAQFDTATLDNVETYGADAARMITAAPTGAVIVYGEGTVQTPRYRTWSGSSWSAESSAQSVGGTIQWMRMAAGTQRNEYVLGTQDALSDVNVQVYDADAGTWGDLQEVTGSVSNTSRRGFDVAYETSSGDALVVYCDGDADPSYRIWNGSSWGSVQSINLSSANNCEWIQLASDPTTDEIIVVARDTGTQYEAQVWDGSAWGNSVTLGSMSDVAHEGIAVQYEESGDQAVIAVSNGTASSFAWASWDGSAWGTPATQTLGDDFEWGVIRRDDGSDTMALCYADEDDDLGVVKWDGVGWQAAGEFEVNANVGTSGKTDGRPVSCEFQTTAGSDGDLLIAYSDTGGGRYQTWDGSAYSGENSISTVQDSWTVSTVRTGDGLILSYFHDDVNSRYDVSYWNGSSWATAQTIENSPSVTAEPFREPIAMAAQVYQSLSGSITSDPIAFSLVPGRPTWGEVLWGTTEPSGTDVKLQVYYGASCASIVPDVALSGNSTGFDASASPIDLSALSTTTYSQLCLKATLSSTNQNAASLNNWSLSWERQPFLVQSHYRWYANALSLSVTDPWPSGTDDLSEDTAIPSSYAPSPGDALRLRLGIADENVALSASGIALRLQYAVGATCSAGLSWADVGAIGSTTAAWRGRDNSGLSDGSTLPTTVLVDSDAVQTYEEANDSSYNPNAVAAGNIGEWDWVLEHNGMAGTNYCFRAIDATGEAINQYDLYPSLVTNSAPSAPSPENPFDNTKTASTTPWFEFSAEDPDGDDVTYQIQIDDDYAFGSPALSRDSQTNFAEFSNIVTPSDKDPFTNSQTIRFVPASALSNGTTYYWRVRAKDRTKSAQWSEWSSISSVTIDTSITVATWFQTMQEQFDTDALDDTETTASDDVILSSGFTVGTTTGTGISFDWGDFGNAWGALRWADTETGGTILYHVEYWNGADWQLIPDSDLSGNAAGFGTSPVSLLGLSPTTYEEIRVRANLAETSATPHLLDWTVEWGYAVEQPTLLSLFDNEKTATTTPTFTFLSTDPQDDDLVYQFSWSSSPTFTSSTTRSSDVSAGFANMSSSTDVSPFAAGDTVRFTIQAADTLTNGQTYWWRVRARDPLGGNTWSVWSPLRSLTVDTSVNVSTWFQTTGDQFLTDTLSDTEVSGNSVQITSTIREAFMAYAEGTVQAPRLRLWNGTSWGTEQSGISVGDTIRFAETDAAPTRDEYLIATMGSTGGIYAQVYDGTIDAAGNKIEISTASNVLRRGYDVAYETNSGDAIVAACYGTEAVYRVWNGTSWSATSTIALSISGSCEWLQLASDPVSDEIIMVVRDTITGATDYEALVWSGSSWGNSTTMGSQATAADEGIAVQYEESGGQAVVVVSNGANNNFIWRSWNGSTWSGTATVAIGNDFAGGRIARDDGSDNMALCYTDVDNDLGIVHWDGAAWSAYQEYDTLGNSFNGRPVSCEYEVTAGRDGYVMIPYSNTTQVQWTYWNGSSLSTPVALSTITDSWEVRTVRTGDGLILAVAYDDANTDYDFSYWNGTSWSTEEVFESTAITTTNPRTVPLDIVARRYPALVAGAVISPAIAFSDGLGPKWAALSFSQTTPGASTIAYQFEYLTSTSSWALVPDADLPGNSAGTTTSPVDISGLSRITYATLRLIANLTCVSGDCPILNDWTLTWSEGINVSGTIKAYDQSTNVTSGTVAVAVNGVLQSGKTGAISGGTWSIPNVTAFEDDVVTVFVLGAASDERAVGITIYDGEGDITGIPLFRQHLTLGSNDTPTLANANIAQYDNSVSGSSDIFYDVDAGNDLMVCAAGGCATAELYITSGTTYRPDSTSSGNVTTPNIEIDGTLVADGNTFTVSGSWDNDATFTKGASTVVFSATSTVESVDSTGASSASFNNITFGSSASTARWDLASALDVTGTLTINYGTLAMNGMHPITLSGDLTIGSSGIYSKGTASTTFSGTGSNTWTDNTSSKQDMGDVVINGTTKTVLLGAGAKATNITIGADDTLSVNNNYALEVIGDWTNNNVFVAQSGTVIFSATSTGRTIAPGSSNFYNVTFNGSGGNWSFSGATVTAGNNFTITLGTVTLPTGTTTVTGNFDTNGGTFMHNNGVVLLDASGAKTVRPGASSFYDLTFNGTGSWSFTDANATSSRNTTITAGTVTAPSGVFAIGGSYAKNGGTFTHNSGTLKFTSASTASVKLGGSDAYDLTFDGVGGQWTFTDTNATSTNNVSITNGSTTLPSGILAIGGSFVNSGVFTHNSGTVKFYATATGKSVTPGVSPFYDLAFNSSSGGWTITDHATSTRHTTITNASSFTLASGKSLAVGGTFTNSVAGAATTWTDSTLYLNSATTYSINTKTSAAEVYGTIKVGLGTDIRMWNSTSTVALSGATGSLFSQDHNNVDGDLYIWGHYTATTGEYWTYATDFEGTALGGSSRQVNVKIASSSVVVFSAGTNRILGGASASTTVSVQGSGAYTMSVTGGTLNAQYYQFRNIDAAGLSISGTTAITSLANGDFELAQVSGASMMTVASTVIDANPALQIQQVSFATSTGVTSGYNVVESGTPSSYWWFRNHYGNYDGEDFDNDPAGNPGSVRWDDSAFSITVSGHVYSDHGSSAIGDPPCDGSSVVTVVVSGGGTYTGSCNAGSGLYSIPNVVFIGDVTLTTYLNTNGGRRAVTVTKTPTADILDMDLYENALILRHENTSVLTIADLVSFDSTDDSDVFFTATVGGTDTLTTEPETEIYVWGGKTFAPGGNVTLQSGGSGNARDGRLELGASAVFTEASTQTLSIGGGLIIGSGAVFTPASSVITFTATTTGKSINSASALTLYDVVFNGSGGGWSLDSAATATTTVNSLTLTDGTISGTGHMVVQTGGVTGGGTITMTGGTWRFEGTGNFGNSNSWQFKNLMLGNGASAALTKTGSATTTVTGGLTLASGYTLNAGSALWYFTGGGTPFTVGGTFTVQTAPFSFVATSSTLIYNGTYAALTLAPAAAGSPTYTLRGGTLTTTHLTIGDGTNPVTVTADTNDPSLAVTGNLAINAGATLIASNVGAFDVGGDWTNAGTFTHSNAGVNFNASATGKTITTGGSSFYDLTFNGASGGWTITDNATSTHDTTITAATSFILTSGRSLAVGGTFTNSVGGGATTWTGTTLFLNSGTSYSINTKSAGGDTYGTLLVGASSHIRMWNSSAATVSVDSTGSLYSQDHAAVDGDLYIWGAYTRSSGSDYWSYATDFDGTDISGTPRQVDVRIATSATITVSGGLLDIIGISSATTTIANQGVSAYAFAVSGGTLNANYYSIRNTDASGLSLSGSPTITSLSYGDFELSSDGGTPLTVAGSVIDANPLKIMQYNRFATSSGVTTGSNVIATGSTGSSWKFNLHYGGFAGESYDSDPTGDPGYLRWDDSASQITIAGNVYSDEGSTVSTVCDNSTQVVKLVVQGTGVFTASCNSSTGAYSIPGISFNPGDTLTMYLNTDGGRRAATISVDPVSSISNMHLYENRVIVRHEDTTPITIVDMIQYDSDEDADIPFDATDAGTDTLIVQPDTKLIVWDGKTFAPAGDLTLQSGGSGTSYDGSLEVRASGVFSAAGTQSHAVGGSFILGTGATFSSANSTVTFTATTTGKTITPGTSSFYNITFNGTGGNWAFGQASATSTNNFTISAGTVTLPTGTLEVGSTFDNAGGTFMHNNGQVKLTATATGKNIRAGGSSFYDLTANGSGGGWTFLDTTATSTRNFTITAGAVTLPSSTFVVGGSFLNSGTFTSGSNTVKFTAAASGKSIQAGGSNFYNVTFDGSGGEWTFLDTNATLTNSFTLTNGSTTLPAGILTVGGSFVNAGTFTHGNGTVRFNATATGKSITAGGSDFYNLTLDSASGGWTITDNATSTHDTTITAATSFTLTSGRSLAVGGTFTNSVGGGATTWTGTTLFLNSGTSYSINTKSAAVEVYGTLLVGNSTHIRMWNASANTTTVDSTGSLYSQDHTNANGDLYIWGAYTRSSGSDYWSYATDFDGTDISGTPRQVDVRIATSSTITISGGTLNIVGAATATTTVANQGSSSYALAVSGGTLNAGYYQIRNTDSNGLNLSGAPAITSLSNGDYELSVNGGAMITLAATVIDANASLQSTGIQFATSTGISSGYNVLRTGSPVAAWTFSTHYGNYDGEAFDSDGGDACGSVRWDDSSCLFVSQAHYRWRNDDGGEGALATEWYDVSWSARKKVAISNPNATSYSNLPVKIVVDYATGMQSDFDDLRFTDSSGTTTLPFWRESTSASASTTLWVKVPTLSASGSAVIYMYYNNSGASAADDGSGTFTFFEDFESGSLGSYSGSDVSLFTAGTTFNHNGIYGLGASTGNAGAKTTNGGIYRTTSSYTGTDKTIRFFQYVDATQQDEPCTLFAVQGSAQNYAVCLDEYPTGQLSLAKNVTSNDGGGTMLASTSVTYATGWYQVVIDWLSNLISVNVYDDTGTLFATATSSDSTYSSGGVGFSFWGQHGGWDFYSTRAYTASAPTYVFGVAQGSDGATWAAAEDTTLTGLYTGQNVRLRFSIQNTGSQITGQLFGLQVAAKGAALSCEAVSHGSFSDVPTTSGGCGSSPACMTTSAQFTDQSSTAGMLTYPASMNFGAGKIVEDPSSETTSMTVNSNTATEVEYNFQMTNNATQSNYCFRVANDTADLDDYARVAQVTIVHAPQISNFALNNAADIVLTEGATTTVSATGTVTDLNGYSDILFATSTIYRSSVAGGAMCSADTNSCYQVASTSCSFSNCSGNACTVSCSADIQYYADPTDVGSTYATSTWLASIAVEDSTGLRNTDTSLGVDLLTLRALSITTGIIDFGALEVGQNTGTVNATTTSRNTGNVPIDIKVSGTDLTGASTIDVGEQKYATSTFVYSSCSICGLLTGVATAVNVNVSKPTSTSAPQTQDIYFGIDVPSGKAAGSYSGTNYFDAVAPGG